MAMHRCTVAGHFVQLMCKITNVECQAVIDDRGLEGADLEYGVTTLAPITHAAVHHPCVHTQCASHGGNMADLLFKLSRCSKAS